MLYQKDKSLPGWTYWLPDAEWTKILSFLAVPSLQLIQKLNIFIVSSF